MIFNENNVDVFNYQSSKVDIRITWQTMETMIEFKLPIRMSELNGKNKWVDLRKSDDLYMAHKMAP